MCRAKASAPGAWSIPPTRPSSLRPTLTTCTRWSARWSKPGNRGGRRDNQERGDRGPRRDHGPRRGRDDGPGRAEREQYYARPQGSDRRNKEPDPNSPFAKLAALKQQLEQNKDR